MKTKCSGCSIVRTVLVVVATLACSVFSHRAVAEVTVINFENIPPTYTPVDTFGPLLPGVRLSSSNQWIADALCGACFENMYGRAITAFPDGAAPLSIQFDTLVQNVTMDFGSSMMGSTLTIGVTGYRDSQVVFTDSFVTHPVAGGADEVRAQTFGVVDRLVLGRTGGDAHLILDNLSFTAIPEPARMLLDLTAALVPRRRLIRLRIDDASGKAASPFRVKEAYGP
ncbi:MAG TPA: hypothetical protein VGP99_05285 [Tepidisphaeraceae bacterium]|jgi:hypothetical protein|nr:hypothetical protein [Tepidisphaeraceae bacterium]